MILKNQVIIATGAGQGIGRAAALKLAEAGADAMCCVAAKRNPA